MSLLYPVAATPEAALSAPLGRAVREREATDVAGREVEFVTEDVGPAFETEEAARAAFTAHLRDGSTRLREVVARTKGRLPASVPAQPVNLGGRRWPAAPPTQARTLWRLSISYWRIVDPARFEALEQARKARKSTDGEDLAPAALRALARQPLRPVRPQQPLDVGLFEVSPPEAPHILMPDE